MAEKTIKCQVVTPTKALLSEQIIYASVPAWDGLFGAMYGTSPLVAKLGIGELRLDFPDTEESKGGSRSYYIDGGFAKMSNEGLTILAETAIPVEALSATEADAELAGAMARQADLTAADATARAERVTRDRQRARVKVRLARNSRAGGI